MFRKLVLCAATAAVLALSAAAWAGGPQPGDLFGSTGAVGGSLILIDPDIGSGVTVGPLGMFGPVSDIEFRADGVLFGTTGAGSANLVTINSGTGAETLVGTHDLFGAVNGLEFVGGTLYGSLFAPPGPKAGEGEGGKGVPDTLLVTIDQTDASLTVIGTITGISPVRGLAYDSVNGVMYGVGLPQLALGADAPEGISDVLFTVDLTTGVPTVIGSTGVLLGALEFGPDGTLYAGEASVGGPAASGGWASGSGTGGDAVPEGGSALLYTIDPATATATPVGPSGSPAISGLSFLPGGEPGPGGGSVLEIPSLSRLGLLLLAGLLAAAGLFAVRRS